MSDPVCPTHNNQPLAGGGEMATKTTKRKSMMAVGRCRQGGVGSGKEKEGCNCVGLCIWWRRNAAKDVAVQWGAKTTMIARNDVRLPGWRDALRQQ